MLEVCELFHSIQGESTFAGKPCSFIRLSGCNLACSWCDTPYARNRAGTLMSIGEIVDFVAQHRSGIIEVTGGEPLLQEETPALCEALMPLHRTVLVETNGTCDISVLPRPVVRIMDIKPPSSGYADRFLSANLEHLRPLDQVKFVIASRQDYEWACSFADRSQLSKACVIIFSAAVALLPAATLASWLLDDDLDVRLGLQLHKYIWGEDARGV